MSTTHLTYPRSSLLCRLIGHIYKRHHTDIHIDRCNLRAGRISPEASAVTVEYHQCRFCRTRQAILTGDYNPKLIDWPWLRAHVDA